MSFDTQDHSLRALGAAARELTTSFGDLVRSEIHVAKAEMKDSGSLLARSITQTAIFAVLAILGLLPLMAFLVVGLGDILNGNFWLSALIVSVCFFAISGFFGYSAYRKFHSQTLFLPETRETFSKVKEVTRRAS